MRTYRIEIRLIQVAVFFAIIVFVSGLFGAWGNTGRASDPANAPGQNQGKVIIDGTNKVNSKIVAIGDSYTYGYPKDPETAWPKYLAENLNVEVVNKGKTSQTARDVLARFDEDVVNEKPGKVIIFVGTGDALNDVPLEEYQTNLQAIVAKAKANHITPILALPMPFRSVQDRVQELREWVSEYALEQEIMVLDFASVLLNEDKTYKQGLSDDGNYPSPEGHRVMGQYAAQVLQ